jgi:hypothetical protein
MVLTSTAILLTICARIIAASTKFASRAATTARARAAAKVFMKSRYCAKFPAMRRSHVTSAKKNLPADFPCYTPQIVDSVGLISGSPLPA